MKLRTPLLSLLLGMVVLAGCYNLGRRPVAEPDDDDDDSSAAGDDDDAGSDDDDDAADDDDDADDDDTSLDCAPDGATTCWGNDFVECQSSLWTLVEECVDPTPTCDPDLGCLACTPNELSCDGSSVVECNATGTEETVIEDCAPDICVAGECLDSCDLAAQQMSYLGCEFLAVSTANIVGAEFDNDFAVVIAAPASGPDATVTVSRNGSVVATQTVASGATQAIELAMVSEIKNAQQSVTVTGGAYEVSTDVPVAAYQYNPLHFDIGGTPSFTNDASLLLPEHTLSGNYMVSAWPTWGFGSWQDFLGTPLGDWSAWHPGFVAVAATTDGTQVTFDSTTYTATGTPGALSPGGTTTITMNRGDVVQIFSQRPDTDEPWNFCSSNGGTATENDCPASFPFECEVFCSMDDGDLTGSTITATESVAVFAGHMCTFMPYNEWACDHLEEMMFPVETWGTLSVMTAPIRPSGSGVAPAMYRVVANNAGTALTFSPGVTPNVTLGSGEFVQFQTDQDFTVEGSATFYVTQTMLGENTLGEGEGGDPAMGSGIPWLQVRSEYDFLTPDTYTSNYVNVVAPTGTAVDLDGTPISGWQTIGSTGYDVARVLINPGGHHIESSAGTGFGITTYGYASYTSYLYPGGLNFTR